MEKLKSICCCRFCGIQEQEFNEDDGFICLLSFDKNEQSDELNILQKIHACLPVEINENDNLSTQICTSCCNKTNSTYEFIQTIIKTQKMIFHEIKSNNKNNLELELISNKINKLPNIKLQKIPQKSFNKKFPQMQTNDMKLELSRLIEKLKKSSSAVTISKISSSSPNTTTQSLITPTEKLFKTNTRYNDNLNIVNGNHDDDSEDDDDYGDDDDDGDIDNNVENITEEYIENINIDDMENDDNIMDTNDDDPSTDFIPNEIENRNGKGTDESDERRKNTNSTKSKNVIIIKMDRPAAFVCTICQSRFPDFERLKEHIKTSKKCKIVNLTCEVCDKVCDTKKALYAHSLTHRYKSTFVCDECGKTYTNRFNLENHKSSFHGEQFEEYGSIYKCKICENQFTNRKDLFDHVESHSKISSVHLCDTCGKCCSSLDSLRSHIRIHLDIRPFGCSYCAKKFRSRLQLTQHLHVHTGIKPFICSTCGKTFAKRGSLIAHNRNHTGETPYECDICFEKFTSTSKLKTHSKVHV